MGKPISKSLVTFVAHPPGHKHTSQKHHCVVDFRNEPGCQEYSCYNGGEAQKSSYQTPSKPRVPPINAGSVPPGVDFCPTPIQLVSPRSFQRHIDCYEVQKKLGAGSYAEVSLAREKDSGRLVAIKKIAKERLSSELDRRVCKNEITIHKEVHHANIVDLMVSFQNTQYIYLVQEYLGGGDMYTYISEGGGLDEDCARSLFGQCCTAVSYLHKNGIVHRDIKLENLLLDVTHTKVKLCDFGFATYDRGMVSDTPGSPAYATPELLRCSRSNPYYLKPTDVWALGVVLYLVVYADYPFWHDDKSALFKQILYSEPRYWDAEFIPSTMLLDLLQRMLSKTPSARPTIDGVLAHAWFQVPASSPQNLEVPSSQATALGGSPIVSLREMNRNGSTPGKSSPLKSKNEVRPTPEKPHSPFVKPQPGSPTATPKSSKKASKQEKENTENQKPSTAKKASMTPSTYRALQALSEPATVAKRLF